MFASSVCERPRQCASGASPAGQEMLVLEGHTGPVRAVAFSPDGRMLASRGDIPGAGIEAIVWRAVGWDRANPLTVRPLSKED